MLWGSHLSAIVVPTVVAPAIRPIRMIPPARPKNEPISRNAALRPSTVAGYAEGATSAPARSAIPSPPTATAITASANQKRIGPRFRGLTGRGCSGTTYDGGGV